MENKNINDIEKEATLSAKEKDALESTGLLDNVINTVKEFLIPEPVSNEYAETEAEETETEDEIISFIKEKDNANLFREMAFKKYFSILIKTRKQHDKTMASAQDEDLTLKDVIQMIIDNYIIYFWSNNPMVWPEKDSLAPVVIDEGNISTIWKEFKHSCFRDVNNYLEAKNVVYNDEPSLEEIIESNYDKWLSTQRSAYPDKVLI